MAITESAKKAIRQSGTRKSRNLVYKQNIKKLVKKVRALVSQNKKDEAIAILPEVYSALDKAAKKNVIKKNNASRRKARLAKLVSNK